MEDRLKYTLSTVNEWLKFAEGKNAALLAANGATIFGILAVSGSLTLPSLVMYYICFAVFLLGMSSICCLLSFVPHLRLPGMSKQGQPNEGDNLLFYADIANYDATEYLETFHARAGDTSDSGASFIEEAYAQQIVANSRIAIVKYRYFSVALWLTVSAFLTPILAILLYLFRTRASHGEVS